MQVATCTGLQEGVLKEFEFSEEISDVWLDLFFYLLLSCSGANDQRQILVLKHSSISE